MRPTSPALRTHTPRIIAACFPCCLIAPLALANAGTPLMWLGVLHLTFINLIIAAVEALFLTVIARVSFRRALIASLVANYASALVGLWLLLPYASRSLDQVSGIPLDAADDHMLRFILLAFLTTLAVEAPIFFAITRKKARLRRLLVAFLLAQLATYAALLWIYNVSSNASATRLTRDHTMSFIPRDHPATIYYINHTDGDLWRVGLNGTNRERIGPIDLFSSPIPEGHPHFDDFDRIYRQVLAIEPNPTGGEDLIALRDLGREEQKQTLIENLPNAIGRPQRPDNDVLPVDTRPQDHPLPELRIGYWAFEGLRIYPNGTNGDAWKDSWSVAYETPLAAWRISRVTILPDNLIVFELGDRQICVLEPNTRTLGVLAEGRSNLITMPGVRYRDEAPIAPTSSPTTQDAFPTPLADPGTPPPESSPSATGSR